MSAVHGAVVVAANVSPPHAVVSPPAPLRPFEDDDTDEREGGSSDASGGSADTGNDPDAAGSNGGEAATEDDGSAADTGEAGGGSTDTGTDPDAAGSTGGEAATDGDGAAAENGEAGGGPADTPGDPTTVPTDPDPAPPTADSGDAGGTPTDPGTPTAGSDAGTFDSGTDESGTNNSPTNNSPTSDFGADDSGASDSGANNSGTGDTDTSDAGTGLQSPTGDPGDDGLYDAGGGTAVVYPSPGGADFGGTVHVRLRANPVAGDAGVATVAVFNTGLRATGQMDLALGVSPSGSAATAVRVADDRVTVRLGHNRVGVYRVPFRLPTTLPAGTYHFVVRIDAANDFNEADETNNVAVGPAIRIGAAVSDLAIAGVNVRGRARADHDTVVTVHLREAGTAAESGTTTVTVMAQRSDGTGPSQQLAVVTVPVRLTRGRRVTVPIHAAIPALPAGRYRVTVRVTPVSADDGNLADKSGIALTAVVG